MTAVSNQLHQAIATPDKILWILQLRKKVILLFEGTQLNTT